jgi:predicted transcriptional regulator
MSKYRTWIEIVFDILQCCQNEKPQSLSSIYRHIGIAWNQSNPVMRIIEKNELAIINDGNEEKYNTACKILTITPKGTEFIKKFDELKEYIKQ